MIQISDSPPLYLLDFKIDFPDPSQANNEGLVAVGGDFSIPRLLKAYKAGIFPWFMEDELIYWFCPNPRMLLNVNNVYISTSLERKLNNPHYSFSINRRFEEVIRNCAAQKRCYDNGTWISPEFIRGFINLHDQGYAISVETYYKNELIGGLYGVMIGNYFSGESMFHLKSDGSKLALVHLADYLKKRGTPYIDCQIGTDHLMRMGAQKVERDLFLKSLQHFR